MTTETEEEKLFYSRNYYRNYYPQLLECRPVEQVDVGDPALLVTFATQTKADDTTSTAASRDVVSDSR
ncbi:uncharacterized protein LOC143181743 isoform X2 [Calliopsis andreniformis]|uniref:uncharacterized protein LOC143181743 isoform X2 n=1 Tax=Calliopsis andreniformis TaxID=337506 RepID=UPI003FCD4B15